MTPRNFPGFWVKPTAAALFIDTNIPIYAAGSDHPLKPYCQRVIMLAARHHRRFVTSSAVLQEIIHYYLAGRRWEEGRGIFHEFVNTMRGSIESVQPDDAIVAAELANQDLRVGGHDLIHVAVMRRLGINEIISADRDFDRIDGVHRLDPATIDRWPYSVLD